MPETFKTMTDSSAQDTTIHVEPDYSSKSDEELVQLFQSGHPTSFNEIVNRYKKPLFNTAFYMVSDYNAALDITQQAFVNAYEGLPDFRLESTLKTWLYQILKNLCYSHHRKEGRNQEIPIGEYASNSSSDDPGTFPEPETTSPPPTTQLLQQEKQKTLREALQQVKDDHRTVLILRDFQDHSYDEISNILEIPVGTVRSRIYRARQSLKEKIEQRFDGDIDEFLDFSDS